MRRPRYDAVDIARMMRRGEDVVQLLIDEDLSGQWLEYAGWCYRNGYNPHEPEEIADDLMELEQELFE